MIRFLLGRPGFGKSTRLTEEIRARVTAEPDRRVYLIVPEQQAYSSERDVLSVLEPAAARSFSIITFSRLCDILGSLYGGRAGGTVTPAMKALLMWDNLRELSGLLEAYTAPADGPLCADMLRAVNEFKANAVTSAQLEGAAARLGPDAPLYGKLRDFALVSSAFDGKLTDAYGENPADRLMRAAEQLRRYGYFNEAAVYIDSFSSFTMQEYAVLREVFREADEVTVALDIGGRMTNEPQFDSIADTLRRLTVVAEEEHCPFEDIVLTECRRQAPAELQILERELWAFDLRAEDRVIPSPEEQGHIGLLKAPTAYEEAEAAALHILKLAESGVPYRQMAVVVRDTTQWSGILDAALERYHIPFFLSKRTDLNEKPAARLLLTALRSIAYHYQTPDIMALCKTGLMGVDARDVDYFSEYVDTWELGGARMADPLWSMNPDGYTTDMTERGQAILDAANRVRRAVMEPLRVLEASLKGAERVSDQCRALYAYLTTLNVKAQLAAQAEELLALGQVREAGESVRLWSFLAETLSSIAEVMDEHAEPLNPEEWITALSLVFAETDIGSVPARYDCVTVGSAATLRVDNLRAMLMLGLCEGEFPKNVSDSGLLTEQDKAVLAESGVPLDSRADKMASEELLYVYRAMTKPSESLYLSYSTAAADGQAHHPSAAFTRVAYLFDYLTVLPFTASLVDPTPVIPYHDPDTDTVSKATARQLLGERIRLSQSQLKTFSACPYSYYGQKLLKLREPAQAKFENQNAGLFLHHVLEQYLRTALDEENHIRPLTPEENRRTADRIIAAYMADFCAGIRENGRLLRLFDRLRKIAYTLIDSIQAELMEGSFGVAGVEWDTNGKEPGDPAPFRLPLNFAPEEDGHTPSPVELIMGGRIDRVDFFRAPDHKTVYIRVIDYKASKHEFSLASLQNEMNIQLLLYLFTMCSPENRRLFRDAEGRVPDEVKPAEILYISPDETAKDGTITTLRTGMISNDEAVLRAADPHKTTAFLPSVKYSEAKGTYTGKNLFSEEDMTVFEDTLKKIILETAAQMYEGRASRTPSPDGCAFCPMRAFCSFCAPRKEF